MSITAFTHGFDVAVQLSERFLNKILAAAYFTRRFPDYLDQHHDGLFGAMHVELYLDCPTVNLLSGQRVEFRVDFTLRIEEKLESFQGSCLVQPLLQLRRREQDGVTLQFLRLDFSHLGLDHVQVQLTPSNAVYEGVGRSLLLDALEKVMLDLPLSPVIGRPFFVAFRRSADSGQSSAPTGQPDRNFVSLFVNLDGRELDPPSKSAPQLVLGSDSLSDSVGRLALPEAVFMPPLRQALAAAGLNAGRPLPGAGDLNIGVDPLGAVTLRRLDLERDIALDLEPGHVRLRTAVRAVLDNAPDVVGSVDAHLVFVVETDRFAVRVPKVDVDIDIDVPLVVQIIAAVLTNAISLIVEQVLEEVLARVLESVLESELGGEAISVPLPEQTVFIGAVAVTTGGPVDNADNVPTLLVRSGGLTIEPDGLVLSTHFALAYQTVPPRRPPEVRANRISREFHQPGCHMGDRILFQNLITFPYPQTALKAGYDGCRFCYPQFDGNAPGELELRFGKLGLVPGEKRVEAVLWRLELVKGVLETGSAETQNLEVAEEHTVFDDGRYVSTHVFKGLRPGTWRVSASQGEWTATAHIAVWGDRKRVFLFTFGLGQAQKL